MAIKLIPLNESQPMQSDAQETQTIPADFLTAITELKEHLLLVHPSTPILLQRIHKQLKEQQYIATLLSEDQIRIIIDGLKHQTGIALVAAATPKKRTIAKNITVDDI